MEKSSRGGELQNIYSYWRRDWRCLNVVHHYKNLSYFRILKSLKEFFPSIYIYLFLEGNYPELTKQLFELDPNIDEIILAKRKNFYNEDIYAFAQNECKVNKFEHGKFFRDTDPETVFRRTINRIYVLLRFPRVRAISMDTFFQQMQLEVNDFKPELARIFLSKEEEKFGLKMKKELCLDYEEMVGIHMFSQDGSRACYPADRWDKVMELLVKSGYKVVLFGSGMESDINSSRFYWWEGSRELVEVGQKWKDKPYTLNLICDDYTLREKIAVLNQCDCLLAVESGMAKIGWLHAIPTITLTKMDRGYIENPHGYMWAVGAGEPYARCVSNEISPKELVNMIEEIKENKGKRISRIWIDQR